MGIMIWCCRSIIGFGQIKKIIAIIRQTRLQNTYTYLKRNEWISLI